MFGVSQAPPQLPPEIVIAASDASSRERRAADLRCSGINDHVVIAGALALGVPVRLTSGTFNLDAQLTSSTLTSLRGAGSRKTTLRGPNVAEGTPGILLAGSRAQVGTNAAVSANIARGAYQITLAENLTAAIAVGDVLSISSNDIHNPKRQRQTRGEFVRVKSITATTLTLEHPTEFAYTTANTIKLFKYSMMSSPILEGFTVLPHPADTDRATLFKLSRATNVHLSDVRAVGVNGSGGAKEGIVLHQCWGGTVDRPIVVDVWDANRDASTPTGYGNAYYGCRDIVVNNGRGRHCRHSFEVGIDNTNPESNGTDLVALDVTFNDCVVRYDTSSGFSSHGHSRRVTFNRCKAIGCGGGVATRGDYTTIRDLDVIGVHSQSPLLNNTTFDSYERAIWIGEVVQQGGTGSDYAGIAGTGLVIENVRCAFDGATRYAEGTTVANNRTYTYIESYEPLVNATIKNVVGTGATGFGIYLRGNQNDTVEIMGGSLDMSAGFASSVPIYIQTPAGAGFYNRGIDIERVAFLKPKNPCVRIVGASSNGADNATAINITRCRNQAQGTTARALLEVTAGTFAGVVRVRDNHCPDIASASVVSVLGTIGNLVASSNLCSDGLTA